MTVQTSSAEHDLEHLRPRITHARHAETQERLTKRVAEHLQRQLSPYGVGVVIDPESRAEFLSLARPSRGAR